MNRVLVFDPGDHTGWVFRDGLGNLEGGCIYHDKDSKKDFQAIGDLFIHFVPDVVVFETFHLYAGAAQHLVHSDFYTCQVIGAIKLIAYNSSAKFIVPQAPSVKKYSGGLDNHGYLKVRNGTEHTKDAYLHLKFFERNNEAKLKQFRI